MVILGKHIEHTTTLSSWIMKDQILLEQIEQNKNHQEKKVRRNWDVFFQCYGTDVESLTFIILMFYLLGRWNPRHILSLG